MISRGRGGLCSTGKYIPERLRWRVLDLGISPGLECSARVCPQGAWCAGPCRRLSLVPRGNASRGTAVPIAWPLLSASATCSFPARVPSWQQKAPQVSVSSQPIHGSEGDRRGPWGSILQAQEQSACCSSHPMTAIGIHRTECFADMFMVSSPSILEWILLCQWYRQESRVRLPMSLIQKMVGLGSDSLSAGSKAHTLSTAASILLQPWSIHSALQPLSSPSLPHCTSGGVGSPARLLTLHTKRTCTCHQFFTPFLTLHSFQNRAQAP